MPFGVLFAHRLAKMYGSPAEYVRNIDRLLIYLSRYGRQPATEAQYEPTVTLLSWADRVHEFLDEERRQADAASKGK